MVKFLTVDPTGKAKVVMPTNGLLLNLQKIISGEAITRALIDKRTGSDYVVPANRKATIIAIASLTIGVITNKIIQSDAATSSLNPVNLLVPQGNLSNVPVICTEVPAGKYICLVTTDTTATAVDLFIVEEDA